MGKLEFTRHQKSYIHIKNIVGQIMGAVGLILLAPVFLCIFLAIKLEDGITAPVFFTQNRVGIHKNYFKLYKFRSMKTDTPHDKPTHLLENPQQYITRVGAFLRRTSLDELPQLFNIAKGDMAVVGPRPALWNQYDLIEERDKYGANDVKPGLTGWAQINGRDELEIPVKAKLDGEYVKKIGILMDLRCFFGTFVPVIRGEGIVEGTAQTTVANEAAPKQKLLIITNHSYMLWQFRKELIVKLQERYEVVISTPFVGREEEFRKLGCRLIETDFDRRGINPIKDIKLIKTYRNILNEEQPKCVMTYSIKPNIYAGMLCRMKHISYAVNVQGLGTAFQRKGLSVIVTKMYRCALKKAKVVFFENEGNAKEFRDRRITPACRQKVLKGAGINLEHFNYNEFQGTSGKKVHFLYIGRIMKEKGVDELFEAIEKLQTVENGKYKNRFVLDLVGFFEEEYRCRVKDLKDEGFVKFYGFQEDPRPFYKRASCVVLPSYHEGMSNVLLEGAASGRALITTDIPGCREAVDNGVTGLLCNVKDTESLLQQLITFMNMDITKRAEMGRLGREKMEKEFAKEDVIAETIRALEQ